MFKPEPLLPVTMCERLRDELGADAVLGFYDPAKETSPDAKVKLGGDTYITVAASSIDRVCNVLREDPRFLFDSLMCLSGAEDLAKDHFCVVYSLFSFKHGHKLTLKVRLPKEEPKVKSVQGIWSAANWFEREAFDLFGIHFENHPDLRRLLLPSDWVGHPLRKDYEFPKEYNGISCVRAKLK